MVHRLARFLPLFAVFASLQFESNACWAAPVAENAHLPPALPWNGKSRSLVVAADDPWITPSEESGLTRTPRYDKTVAWLQRLVDATPDLKLVALGKSSEGRTIWMVVAATGFDRTVDAHGHGPDAFSPEAVRALGKPIILAQAGIHSGEIDGKDAGLMLLRDMTVRGTRRALLDRASFLFVPILNVDGHERFSEYGRINQRGPIECGWRTTARNLNLNRDYTKLDAPETRAIVAAINTWTPDLYLDLHVTDGVDYQYDITWGFNGDYGYSPASAAWLRDRLTPAVTKDLRAKGHIPGGLVFPLDNLDPRHGCWEGVSPPRFSTGYGDARHLPSILVENHSLKPYDQRVLGTYVFLESVLRAAGDDAVGLRAAIASDRARRDADVPLKWVASKDAPPDVRPFLGVASRLAPSAVSGGQRVEWLGEPATLDVPYFISSAETLIVARPAAYWIPRAWGEVIECLARHGIEMEQITEERTVDVEVYRIADARTDGSPFEGRARAVGTPVAEPRRVRYPAGSVRVSTDQPLGDLAIVLLEPKSEDSFYQWGFFLETMQRTEYAEAYVMEPMAERMLAEDPAVRAEFEAQLAADSTFAASAEQRLDWFYRRTPYFDSEWRIHPVAREVVERR